MSGLYNRDYNILTDEEIAEKKRIDDEGGHVSGAIGRRNFLYKYPKAIRHNLMQFPNNYLDINLLKETEELNRQCNEFEELLNNDKITELHIKRFIQNNKYYHIPASIFSRYNFGHHEAALFKEFSLGTNYKADYLLTGRASGGWQFIYIEFENPYNNIVVGDGNFGDTIRKGLNQIDDWKTYLAANYSTISTEFEKNTSKDLPKEFTKYDETRIHFAVVAGRRKDFENEKIRIQQRRLLSERKITLLHYDNILDDARKLIGANTY